MKEKVLGELAEIIGRPTGLNAYEKDFLLDELNQTGDLRIWGDAFKAYIGLREQIRGGVINSFSDVPRLKLLRIVLDKAFESDTDMFLNRWQEAQQKQFP